MIKTEMNMNLSTNTIQLIAQGKLDLGVALMTGRGLQQGESYVIDQMIAEHCREQGLHPDDDFGQALDEVQLEIIDYWFEKFGGME